MSRVSTSLATATRRLLSTSSVTAPPTITVKKALDSTPSSSAPLVRMQGWVRSVRRQKQLAFIELCDGSTSSAIQLVLPPSSLPAELFMGSSVMVRNSSQSVFVAVRAPCSNSLCMPPDVCKQRPRAVTARGAQRSRWNQCSWSVLQTTSSRFRRNKCRSSTPPHSHNSRAPNTHHSRCAELTVRLSYLCNPLPFP